MRFVIRKYIDATTVREAIDKEPETPIHDCYLKEGEEPPKSQPKDLIGFRAETDPYWRKDEIGRKP
jgi:hypothetical protein